MKNSYPGYKARRVILLAVLAHLSVLFLWTVLPRVESLFCPFWSELSGHTYQNCQKIIHWTGGLAHVVATFVPFFYLMSRDCTVGIEWGAKKPKKKKKIDCDGCPRVKELETDVRPYLRE